MHTSHLTAAEAADALAQIQQRLTDPLLVTARAQQDAFRQGIQALRVVAALGAVARHEAGYYEQPPARVPMDVPQVAGLLVSAIQEQAECLVPNNPEARWAFSTVVRLLWALNAVACGRPPDLWLEVES